MCKLTEAGEICRKRSKVEFEDQKDPERAVRHGLKAILVWGCGQDRILYLRGQTVHLLWKEDREIRCVRVHVGKDYISKQKDQELLTRRLHFHCWARGLALWWAWRKKGGGGEGWLRCEMNGECEIAMSETRRKWWKSFLAIAQWSVHPSLAGTFLVLALKPPHYGMPHSQADPDIWLPSQRDLLVVCDQELLVHLLRSYCYH